MTQLPPSPYDPSLVDAAAERAVQFGRTQRTRVEREAIRAAHDPRVDAEMDRLQDQGEFVASGHLMNANMPRLQGALSPDERFAQARWAAENLYTKYPSIGSQQMTQLLLGMLDQLEGGPAPDPNVADEAMLRAISHDADVEIPRRILNARQVQQGGELNEFETEFDDVRRQRGIDEARRQAERRPEAP